MIKHAQVSDLLPEYAAGTLDRDQRLVVDEHLVGCAACRADLALWQSLAGELVREDQALTAPTGLVEDVLRQAAAGTAARQSWRRRAVLGLRRVGLLLRSQVPLVQREIWPASAAVIGLGYIAALVSEQAGFVYALAPLVAAGCMSLIYGPDQDPAYELALATPTSPRQILLSRLVLVFGYNLGLVLVATLGLLPLLPQVPWGGLLLNWLAPMTFLSTAALLLSLWIGAPNAISITYLAWLGQLLAGPLRSPQAALEISPPIVQAMAVYQSFWSAPALLLAYSAVLLALAFWLAGRQSHVKLTLA